MNVNDWALLLIAAMLMAAYAAFVWGKNQPLRMVAAVGILLGCPTFIGMLWLADFEGLHTTLINRAVGTLAAIMYLIRLVTKWRQDPPYVLPPIEWGRVAFKSVFVGASMGFFDWVYPFTGPAIDPVPFGILIGVGTGLGDIAYYLLKGHWSSLRW